MFISVPGCTLSIGDPVRFEKILRTAMPAIRNFMDKGLADAVIGEIDRPDVLLWCIWAIQQYARNIGVERCKELYAGFVADIIHYIADGKHPDMKPSENGLLYAEGKEKTLTWINATVNGKPVIMRSGYIV